MGLFLDYEYTDLFARMLTDLTDFYFSIFPGSGWIHTVTWLRLVPTGFHGFRSKKVHFVIEDDPSLNTPANVGGY